MPKVKKIDVDASNPFKLLDDMYGREMFDFCPMFERGYLRKLFIRQHIGGKSFILVVNKNLKIDRFEITAWIHKTNSPYIWREFWCKEHKTICHQVYAPDSTDKITFEYSLGDDLSIRFNGEK